MQREAVTLDELCTLIDETKPRRFSLTAAIRCYVVSYFIEAASARQDKASALIFQRPVLRLFKTLHW